MRYSIVALLTIAVGIAVASPLPDVVSEVGNAIHSFDDASGITDLEDITNAYSNGALDKFEGKTGIKYAEEVLHIERRRKRATKGDIQVAGKGLKLAEDATGLTAAEDYINLESGGAYNALNDASGVTTIEKAIGATRK